MAVHIAGDSTDLLHELAEQAATRTERLAAILVPYARVRGWTRSQFAAALGCSESSLPRLLLARSPRADGTDPEAPEWQAAARTLAHRWEADAGRLESVLRAALHCQADSL